MTINNAQLQRIKQNFLFQDLAVSDFEQLISIAQEKQYQKNESIFMEGDPGSGFFILLDGQVKIYKLSPDGKEQILHFFGAGEPFGEVAVFAGKNFPANALAIIPSRALFFPRTSFVELIKFNPSLCMNMLAVLSLRLRQFTVQVEQLTLKEVPQRLATYLLYLAKEENNFDEVNLPVSKGQLAGLLGTIPETISRIFGKLSQAGLIRVNGRQIDLLDAQGLAEFAQTGVTPTS